MVVKRTLAKKPGIIGRAKNILFSSQGFPIFLTCTIIALLFVLFRMKGVELDYEVANLKKTVELVGLENKKLKAKRARLLSTKNLRNLAKKYDLYQPKQSQIIVIP